MMNHKYICKDNKTEEIWECKKLPPLLRMLREQTGYTYKVPHGNKVRTHILEDGECNIGDGIELCRWTLTIERW